jgi:hypothetical protein
MHCAPRAVDRRLISKDTQPITEQPVRFTA